MKHLTTQLLELVYWLQNLLNWILFVCSIAEKKVPIWRNISDKNRETFTYNFHNERHVWHLSDPAYEFVWWISWVMQNLNVWDCPLQRIPKDIVVHELFCPKFPLNAFRLPQQREYLILKLGFVTWIPHLRLNHSLENWKSKWYFSLLRHGLSKK